MGLTQDQVAERGNFPQRTYAAVETAKRKSYRATTLANVDRGLDWEPGTAGRILSTEGWRPDEPEQPMVDALEELTEVMRDLVQAVQDLRQEPALPAQLAAIWEHLSEEDQQYLLQGAMRLRNTHNHPRPNDTGAGAGG